MPPPTIVVAGSSNTDLIVTASRLPLPGETVLGGDLITAAGGKGANQAVAAARLGAQVTFIARLGTDMFGEQAAHNLAAEGLDLRYLRRDASAPSGVALIVVGPGGQNIIAVAPGANSRLSPADVAEAAPAFEGARAVLLQLEVPLETVQAAAEAGRRAGAAVVLNPAPAQALPDSLLRLVDILTPNATEAALLTGQPEPEAAAQALLNAGVGAVVITLGESGALVAEPGRPPRHVPAFKVEAVDTVGAGDAFNGGLAVALAEGQPLAEAARYAAAVAALSVTQVGAQPSLPTRAAVEAFLAQH